MSDLKWLDEIAAQLDSTVPYYLPAVIRRLREAATEIERLTAERDLAVEPYPIAVEPYPTAVTYDAVCKALLAEREKSARLAAERDEAQRRLHTAWVDQRDSKVEAAEAEVKRLAAENARLKSACDGLLTFIRQKYPADFVDGGSGYSCEHHRKIAGLIYGTPEEPR